jgi:hypothetical protein
MVSLFMGFTKPGVGRGAWALVRRLKRCLCVERSRGDRSEDNGPLIARGRFGIYSIRGESTFLEKALSQRRLALATYDDAGEHGGDQSQSLMLLE